jgi:large-conductance mechanosensitive channel
MKRIKLNKDKILLVILIAESIYLVFTAPADSRNSRVAGYGSIRENPVSFIIFASIVVIPIYLIERYRKKSKRK